MSEKTEQVFAVISTGGKQYHVSSSHVLAIEKIESEPGSSVLFPVLMAGRGGECLTGAAASAAVQVSGQVMRHFRDEKKIIFKKKRRHNYRRKKGHRQHLTLVKIGDIRWSA